MSKSAMCISSSSIEAIVHDFYDVISGLAGGERDWDKMRSLFIPGARFVPSAVVCGTSKPSAVDIDTDIQKLEVFLSEHDFFETGFICHIEMYGNIASVVSTYEARHAQNEIAPYKQGINFIHLLNDGKIREWLTWPLNIPPSETWTPLVYGDQPAPMLDNAEGDTHILAWRFEGICPPTGNSESQTLLCASTPGPLLAPLWIGLQGPEQRLSLLLSAAPGRSPHYWMGPALPSSKPFSIQVAMHTGMGPGGLLWRWDDSDPWSSMFTATAWGAERFGWQARWSIGHDQHGPAGRPFLGTDLNAAWTAQICQR